MRTVIKVRRILNRRAPIIPFVFVSRMMQFLLKISDIYMNLWYAFHYCSRGDGCHEFNLTFIPCKSKKEAAEWCLGSILGDVEEYADIAPMLLGELMDGERFCRMVPGSDIEFDSWMIGGNTINMYYLNTYHDDQDVDDAIRAYRS